MTDWRQYERFVAGLMASFASDNFTVIPNTRLRGCISRVERQIDVLIDAKWDDDTHRRVIVDAKRYKNKIDVKDIETFEGMMKDCSSQYGVIVCPQGYTEAAKRRAQDAITIKLVPLSELENFNLDSWEPCLGKCARPKRRKSEHGLVLYDSPYGLTVGESPLSIMAVGKCDFCNEFHVWCWDCGQKFALTNEDEFHCHCSDRFWLTAIEDEGQQADETLTAIHLFLVLTAGAVIPVDRRRLQ
jgi:hypothetical protein